MDSLYAVVWFLFLISWFSLLMNILHSVCDLNAIHTLYVFDLNCSANLKINKSIKNLSASHLKMAVETNFKMLCILYSGQYLTK
jgi:hypothetical protein